MSNHDDLSQETNRNDVELAVRRSDTVALSHSRTLAPSDRKQTLHLQPQHCH